MSNILKPPKGKVGNTTFVLTKREDMMRRRNARTGQHALTDETKRAILMDMCTVDVERYVMLS